MKESRLIKSIAIFGLAIMWSIPVYTEKAEASTSSAMVHGEIKTKYAYTGMTIDQVKSHISKLNLNFDDLVTQSIITIEDGVAAINTKLPDTAVEIDNKLFAVTDGQFMIDEVDPGKHTFKIYNNDKLLVEKDITVESGHNSLPIEIDLDITALISNLEDKMQPEGDQMQHITEDKLSIHDAMLFTSPDTLVTPMSDPDYWNG
ncbi:hypothetical protein GCM10010912_64600 [Paenibacillus albidus]|uniref:Uncharacterized protein n=1 Tax=Paenibacillus albidus TaxID=2041023 RepID=A0A917D5M8_9BACL|nr:hypothetical protein [Paenibacillus albidus]GGG11270.1 hypothetical protein GCM10010912_64600 [Paenibacillus albidus]